MTYEQVREEIAQKCSRTIYSNGRPVPWERHTPDEKAQAYAYTDAILSLKYPNGNPMVYVAAEDQSLPDVKGDYAWLSRKGEQKMMTQAGFRRIEEKR